MISNPFLFLFGWYLVFGVLLRYKAFRKLLKAHSYIEDALMLFMSKLLLVVGFGGFFVYWLTNNGHGQ